MQVRKRRLLIGMFVTALLVVGLYNLPPIHSHLAWRVDDVRARIKYFLNPPEQAVFQPAQQAQVAAIVSATMRAYQATSTPTPTPHPDLPTPTPTVTPKPLPSSVDLPGVVYVDQRDRWNYCGPANLTMALNFWGWKGTRDDVAKAIKPGENDPSKNFIERGYTDKNVMPYEMVDFVNDDTQFRALYRYGGNIQLVKTLVANGFPVLAEKGYYEADYRGKVDWLGHYQYITGYNESTGELIVQDTWNDGPNFHIAYDPFMEGWRSFDYLFIVVYPPERETDVFNLLGPYTDSHWAAQRALDIDNQDVQSLQGIDLFFAWFAKGTSHVALQQYVDAATAYDRAFSIYANLGSDSNKRPFRVMWYQTGPYFAYYYSGRYQDVINLANTTLNDTIAEPTLEESLYWRGLAEYALGDTASAFKDVKQSVYLNPNFQAGISKLQEWGLSP
jgi:tetratricopeptide (TPR) repeat protein